MSQTELFRFPSNGNADTKEAKEAVMTTFLNILFPFPSNGNADTKRAARMPAPLTPHRFPFPSNGNAGSKRESEASEAYPFAFDSEFPSNGNAGSKRERPHFKPNGAVPTQAQKHTRTAHGIFSSKFYPKITQTHVYTEPYAIFYQKRTPSKAPSAFRSNLYSVRH